VPQTLMRKDWVVHCKACLASTQAVADAIARRW